MRGTVLYRASSYDLCSCVFCLLFVFMVIYIGDKEGIQFPCTPMSSLTQFLCITLTYITEYSKKNINAKVKYRIAGNFRGAHISRISRMGSNSRTLNSPKLISSLKLGVVYMLACVASQV